MTQLTLDLGKEYVALRDVPEPQDAAFRCLSGISREQRGLVYTQADRVWEAARLGAHGRLNPSLDMTERDQSPSPSHAAAAVRRNLGIRNGARVPSVVTCLDRLGVLVGPLPDLGRDVSAFSCWFDDLPVVLLRATGTRRRRARFDAAHELGHVVLHRGRRRDRKSETEADNFASAFLMPTDWFRDQQWKPFSWHVIDRASHHFGVTRVAALYRAHDIGLLSEPVYRAAMADASIRGWRRHDPTDSAPPELLTDRVRNAAAHARV